MRVLVVGLDGANLDLIKLWAHEGKLPTFEKLIREGSYGNLESVMPTITIPAWNCLASGKNPGKIGIFSFIHKAYGTYDFQIYQSLVEKEKCVWDILSDRGKKVFLFNATNVLHAYKINGYMVAGCLCILEEKLTYPQNLRDELYNNTGYERDIMDFKTLGGLNNREHSRKHKEITEKQCKSFFHFMEKDWDFGFFVLNELDRAQHRFWDHKDILLSHYQNIDRNLKELLDRLDRETAVIIVSDHGFGQNKRSFHINEWLLRKGLLKVKKIHSLEFCKSVISVLKKPLILKMLRPLMKFSPTRRLYLSVFLPTGRMPIVWNETKAFSYATWGTIYINLCGREPQGVVKEEEYEQLRSEIIEGLGELSVKAYRREELYHGEYLELAPDIIIQTDDNVNSISGRVGYGKEFLEGFGGAHDRLNGTFIAWGSNIKENKEINAKLQDVAPTILHMFGIPIPKDMDGRVLKEIFKGELAMREIGYEDLQENEKIGKKIKVLKYSGRI